MSQEEQSTSTNWYVLIYGLSLEEAAVSVGPGMTVRQLGAPLTVFDLAAAGAAGFRGWASLEPFAPRCTSEIESPKDGDVVPGYDALNRAWLVSSLLLLRGYAGHLPLACSTYSWRKIAGHQKDTASTFRKQLAEEGVNAAVHSSHRELPPFRGQILEHHMKLITLPGLGKEILLETDAAWMCSNFERFNELAADCPNFRFALESATDWRYAGNLRIAIARIWAGIEAIFGVSSELVYRISLLSASLLEPRGENRLERFSAIKKLYSIRSKGVHGDKLSNKELVEGLSGSFQLLQALLVRIVELGHPLTKDDFDRAVFF